MRMYFNFVGTFILHTDKHKKSLTNKSRSSIQVLKKWPERFNSAEKVAKLGMALTTNELQIISIMSIIGQN